MMMNLKRPHQDCTQPDYLLRRLRRNHIAWGYLSPRLWLEAATLAGRSPHETGSQAACEMMVNDDITCYALIDYRSAELGWHLHDGGAITNAYFWLGPKTCLFSLGADHSD